MSDINNFHKLGVDACNLQPYSIMYLERLKKLGIIAVRTKLNDNLEGWELKLLHKGNMSIREKGNTHIEIRSATNISIDQQLNDLDWKLSKQGNKINIDGKEKVVVNPNSYTKGEIELLLRLNENNTFKIPNKHKKSDSKDLVQRGLIIRKGNLGKKKSTLQLSEKGKVIVKGLKKTLAIKTYMDFQDKRSEKEQNIDELNKHLRLDGAWILPDDRIIPCKINDIDKVYKSLLGCGGNLEKLIERNRDEREFLKCNNDYHKVEILDSKNKNGDTSINQCETEVNYREVKLDNEEIDALKDKELILHFYNKGLVRVEIESRVDKPTLVFKGKSKRIQDVKLRVEDLFHNTIRFITWRPLRELQKENNLLSQEI